MSTTSSKLLYASEVIRDGHFDVQKTSKKQMGSKANLNPCGESDQLIIYLNFAKNG